MDTLTNFHKSIQVGHRSSKNIHTSSRKTLFFDSITSSGSLSLSLQTTLKLTHIVVDHVSHVANVGTDGSPDVRCDFGHCDGQ